jgi:myo-inositol-1(or 4)-monophosphatase
VLGVIYLPSRDEIFTSLRDDGAFLNNQVIYVSHTATLSEAIIHVADFAKSGSASANAIRLTTITRLANPVGRIRMIGSAATDLAHVACGRADALIMYSNHAWDVEAGRVLLHEAGGKESVLSLDSRTSIYVYSNEYIHQQVIEHLLTCN